MNPYEYLRLVQLHEFQRLPDIVIRVMDRLVLDIADDALQRSLPEGQHAVMALLGKRIDSWLVDLLREISTR